MRGALLLGGVAVAAMLLAGCARAGGDGFQATVTSAIPLGAEASEGAGQTLGGDGPLAGVDLLTATYDEAPDPDGELVVALTDGAGGDAVAEARLPGDEVAANGWVALRFDEPVERPDDPALQVTWTGDSQVGVWANVPPPDADPDERLVNDPYGDGTLLRGGEPAPGDLAFRAVGDPGVATSLGAVARVPAGALARVGAAPLFAVGWALLVLGAVALAAWGFRRT